SLSQQLTRRMRRTQEEAEKSTFSSKRHTVTQANLSGSTSSIPTLTFTAPPPDSHPEASTSAASTNPSSDQQQPSPRPGFHLRPRLYSESNVTMANRRRLKPQAPKPPGSPPAMLYNSGVTHQQQQQQQRQQQLPIIACPILDNNRTEKRHSMFV
ncbi:hypothetical protein BOX15_Mlig015314g2, partial [Macrostomum lignano]